LASPSRDIFKVPHELHKRDEFFAAMKALIERDPKNGYE
jgi:hypothetical protein